jgi:hypothetical protein
MLNPASRMTRGGSIFPLISKKHEIVGFSSIAIALYGYDQGMLTAQICVSRANIPKA